MNRSLPSLVACLLALVLAAPSFAGQSVEITAKSGAKWRGEIGDQIELTFVDSRVETVFTCELLKVAGLYIVVEGELAGKMTKKTVFKADIIAIKTAGGDGAIEPPPGRKTDSNTQPPPAAGKATKKPAAETEDSSQPGVFFLPMEGDVGSYVRNDEVDKIGEHADEYGPGQLIVLSISSNGGLVIEEHEIQQSIYKLSQRHRVVAWVHKALSAGCYLAMCCEEIYFTTEGVCGSVTTIAGSSAVRGPEQELFVKAMVDMAVRQGYSQHIARSMKASRYMCSYDKDEKTGAVTFYGDMSGEYPLSDDKSNLCFNSSNALECGFSKGTADTEEELARLLQLPKWREIDDYGREIFADWKKTCERAEEEIPRILARLQYKGAAGGTRERLGAQINLLKQLVRWWDRCPNVMFMMNLPPKEDLQRQIEEMRRQLARMRGAP